MLSIGRRSLAVSGARWQVRDLQLDRRGTKLALGGPQLVAMPDGADEQVGANEVDSRCRQGPFLDEGRHHIRRIHRASHEALEITEDSCALGSSNL